MFCKGSPDKNQSFRNVLKPESVHKLPTQAELHLSGVGLRFLLATV